MSGSTLGAVAKASGFGVAWDKAPCRFCGTGCHVQVGVEGGKVVRLEGDPDHPVTRGFLCYRTNRFLARQNDFSQSSL
ncbi:MAG: hypothetical protein ABFS34_16950 [Gemmatimonadota bacterium]